MNGMTTAHTTNGLIGLMMNGHCSSPASPQNTYAEGTIRSIQRAPPPYIKIIEQPASKALRFRYECEGRPGGIHGINSTSENRTYPKIRIVNYKGPALIVVSCVTKNKPYRVHPHKLVSKDSTHSRNGTYTVEINNKDMTHTIQNLGIQCVKKKDIIQSLQMREKCRIDPFRLAPRYSISIGYTKFGYLGGITHTEPTKLCTSLQSYSLVCAEKFSHISSPSQIDLNAVRLCFQAYAPIPGTRNFNIKLAPPVVSEPIYDKKAVSELVISRLSHTSGSVKGGQKMILLCEKVIKEDIQILFREVDNGQPSVWESTGEFTTNDVHKQCAISFKTPPYKTIHIDNGVQVQILLKRPSDEAVSNPVPYFYTPDPALHFYTSEDSDLNKGKKRKVKQTSSPNPQNPFRRCGSETSSYTNLSHQPPCGSSNDTTGGTLSGAPQHLAVNAGSHDPQQYPPSPTSLPSFGTWAPLSMLNIHPVQTYPEYYQAFSMLEVTSAIASTSAPGNPFNGNVGQPMSVPEIPEQRELGTKLEQYPNLANLVQNSNCPCDPGELLPHLSQLSIDDISQNSANISESLNIILDEIEETYTRNQ